MTFTKMIWVRKFFGLLLLSVAAVLVVSIVVTFSQMAAYFSLLYTCLNEPCDTERFKDIFFGVITYLFMGFMAYYFSRKGFAMLITAKPDEPETSTILDESEFSHTQENINYFQTKYGYCHVLPDKLIFSASKTLNNETTYTEKNKIIGAHILQLLVSGVMIYYLYILLQTGDYARMSVPLIELLMTMISLFTSFRNSTATLVPRDRILLVSFVKGIPYLITPHFIVWFLDTKNRKRKRVIVLPGSAEKNSSEALRIMQKIYPF